ncbi:MAG: hypothetical protein ACM3SX_20200 [Deltaproteobacteria bacterium]|jgi:hypothetical protein
MSRDEHEGGSRIQGQLLRWSERREVAIYLRDGKLWIADFIDGVGELIEPEAWFRFNCGTPWARRAHRRMLFESATPLYGELVSRIEELHRVSPDIPQREARP